TTEKRKQARMMLILATVECIEERGIGGATIRNIAEKANVNSAAISYYFGGRDELVKQTLENSLENGFDLSDINIQDDDGYKVVLKKVLENWSQGVRNYPRISRTLFGNIVLDGPERENIANRTNQFINDIYNILVEHGLEDTRQNRISQSVMFSAFIIHLIMPEVAKIEEITGESSYIDSLIDTV
ncbi:MAG: TetR/AcrR family transcriptional regulator, partial [Clostridiales bacterium]|nr:TetR/AcrR family transcriptional regulator [Clostridiales bacterium]